jgi:DNA-binding NarL/FixJ family response regulator
VIKVALVDDHPAVRVGLLALLRGEPGLTPVAVPADGPVELEKLLSLEADVALIDGQLGTESGLELCLALGRHEEAPPVVFYSAYLEEELAVAARIAGAAAALNKGEPLDRVLNTVRVVAGGRSTFPPVSAWALRRCAERIDSDDLPVLAMLAHGTSRSDAADTLGLSLDALEARIVRMVATLERYLLPAPAGASTAA